MATQNTNPNCIRIAKNQIHCFLVIASSLFFLTSCQPAVCQFTPEISYTPHSCLIQSKTSAFPPLTDQEIRQQWGKEYYLGISFAEETDLYRAITCWKRALFLLPPKEIERRMQIEYSIVQAYYFGYKYCEAIETFEKGRLMLVEPSFPAYRDLLIVLYDCYYKTGLSEKATAILEALEKVDEAVVEKLEAFTAFSKGDIETLSLYEPEFASEFLCAEKSVQRAKLYNAFLPGAGYLYVGQKKAALTSFLINGLFTWASYRFFEMGNPAAGLITASFETGWYLGGINGAGLAAKEYNQRLYEVNAKEAMIGCNLFPILMLQTSF